MPAIAGQSNQIWLDQQTQDDVFADQSTVSGILWPVEDGQRNVRDILGTAGTILDHRVFGTIGNILSLETS